MRNGVGLAGLAPFRVRVEMSNVAKRGETDISTVLSTEIP